MCNMQELNFMLILLSQKSIIMVLRIMVNAKTHSFRYTCAYKKVDFFVSTVNI